MQTPVKLALYARVALILHAVVLVLLLLYVSKTVSIPLFFAFLVAILLYPVASWLERHSLGRALSAGITVLLFMAMVALFVYFFSSQLINFTHSLPNLQAKFSQLLNNLHDWIYRKYHINDADQSNYLNKSVNTMAGAVASSVGTTFVGMGELLILTIFFFFFTFFILFHRHLLLQFVLAFFSETQRAKVNEVVNVIRRVMNGYVLGLLTEMAILFLLIFTALLVLGIKYALLIAVFAAVLNLIPYVGIYTALVISMVITMVNGTGPQAAQLAIVFVVAHTLDANIILPRIVGARVKMNAFITLLAVMMGKLVWGIPGMFLFIPLMAIIRIISEQVNSLQPWAILMGEERRTKQPVRKHA
ncbi:AI-2E family transporter [Deminuibacter soli]|uniref:AI-2E family transporter n=1 Tax=Deminuibacter soli TaxID=2291815 RepID=A0A3E1NQH7_9BACT|nr:AI-2E family transporter [Deminuibacter soli]RFM30157.1 AI-2E family transporter [Deminuibacter soli]